MHFSRSPFIAFAVSAMIGSLRNCGLFRMRRIRKVQQFRTLPILALTAKAMKGDREKAIESGASDYVTKPVDPDHLLSVMDQWMRGE